MTRQHRATDHQSSPPMRHLTKILWLLSDHTAAGASTGNGTGRRAIVQAELLGMSPDGSSVGGAGSYRGHRAAIEGMDPLLRQVLADHDQVRRSGCGGRFQEFNDMIMPDQALSAGDVDQFSTTSRASAQRRRRRPPMRPLPEAPIDVHGCGPRNRPGLVRWKHALREQRCRMHLLPQCDQRSSDARVVRSRRTSPVCSDAWAKRGWQVSWGRHPSRPWPPPMPTRRSPSRRSIHLRHSLRHADKVSAEQTTKSAYMPFAVYGGGGLLAFLALIGFHWRGRIKSTVKKDIYDRQLRSI